MIQYKGRIFDSERMKWMKKLKDSKLLRLFIAGILCFAAACLTEPTLGALATLPFIIVIPATGYFIYSNILHICGFCALGGFLFKYAIVSELREAASFALVCALYGVLAVLRVKYMMSAKSKLRYIYSTIFFACLISIYFVFHGTFFANLSSKDLNEKYLTERYPEEEFTIGTTYYSFSDKCYLTEFVFSDNEVYRAKIGVKEGKNGRIVKVNGYRDYCEARLLEDGTDILLSYLSNYVHEGEDFALRRDKIEETAILTTDSTPEDFYSQMCYEIAFYNIFPESTAFEEMCRQYVSYIPEGFEYGSIRFYGIGASGEFEYSLSAKDGEAEFVSEPFDAESFERYFRNSDTHKYWEFIK